MIQIDAIPRHLMTPFQLTVLNILQQNLSGLQEYELLQQLRTEGLINADQNRSVNLDLYHQHFILFNNLYCMRDVLLNQELANVQISPMNIQLLPFSVGEQEVGKFDTLREYYLDLNNLKQSSEESVNELLNNFWELFLRNDKRSDALAVLGLEDPVDNQEITFAYRRLVMRMHPDRGGDAEEIQRINQAYSELVK